MNEHATKFSEVPLAACRLAGGEVYLGDNGEGAKSAPVKLKARSGQPIEHWFWGRVVHDLAGMRMHKPRLTVDYAHNESEVLGYLNHFDATSGDLIASGALTPWKDDDRASEVLFKMRQGVPYEASIFFGGDGIRLEEVPSGMVAQVNGYQFQGPGVIVREWPLRGVAICPYGADANTDATAMSAGEKIKVETIERKETKMNEEVHAVEVETGKKAEKAVEVPAVETEAKMADQLTELKAQMDADKAALEKFATDVASLNASNAAAVKERDALKVERDELAVKLTAAQAELAEVGKKLAALMNGAPTVSAASAEKETSGSLMERARKSK